MKHKCLKCGKEIFRNRKYCKECKYFIVRGNRKNIPKNNYLKQWRNSFGSPLKKEYFFERDNFQCTKCGSIEKLEIHHIKPLSYGGKHDEENITVLCHICHKKEHGVK